MTIKIKADDNQITKLTCDETNMTVDDARMVLTQVAAALGLTSEQIAHVIPSVHIITHDDGTTTRVYPA